MKRAFANLDQFYDARDTEKYHTLLLEHLQLQEDLKSEKRRLYITKQKRETLLAEVRFLRRRHKYLLQIQSSGVEDDLNQTHDANIQRRKLLENKRNSTVDDAPSCSPCSVSVSNLDSLSIEEPKEEGTDYNRRNSLNIEHETKELFDSCRRVKKRKVSWHYKTSLETIKEEEEEGEAKQAQIRHELPKMEKLRNSTTNERIVGQIRCLGEYSPYLSKNIETIKEEDQEEQIGHELPTIEKLRNHWTGERSTDQNRCLRKIYSPC